jgi:hypothetical protein
MLLKNPVGTATTERDTQRELDYLYKRLSTVDELIRSLENYDLHRPKPAQVPSVKTA